MMLRTMPFRAFALILVVLLTGCNHSHRQYPKTTFILLDVSSSIGVATRTSYLTYLTKTVVPELDGNERLLLSPVGDQATLNEPDRLVDVELPALPAQPGNGFNDNPALEAKNCMKEFPEDVAAMVSKRDDLRRSIVETFHTLKSSNTTYLLDGFEMAARTLKDYQGEKTLIVLSDGIEDNNEGMSFRFDQPGFWSKHPTASIITQLRVEHRMPDLTGFEIYFVGSPRTAPDGARNIRAFWYAFLQTAGVSEAHIHYGARPLFRPGRAAIEDINVQVYCHAFAM